MKRSPTAKPRTTIQVLVSERYFNYLRSKAIQEEISLSELVRGIIENAIKTEEEAKHVV